ncbi:MAG: DnaD domain-containing protein [Anaerolineae bacterium]
MTKFEGFSAGKPHTIPIHAQFISDVLPLIDDLAELKLCLFCYAALLQKSGEYRYLTRADLADNPELQASLHSAEPERPFADVLDEALARALEHGFLLAGTITIAQETRTLYLMNTAKGRIALQQLAAGHWQPDARQIIEILPERPTIYALYEENIGALTPIIADHLKAAEQAYSYGWIADAIALAVENNVRRWAYINAILERWKQEGRADVNEKTERSHHPTNEFAGLNWSDFTSD